MNMPITVPTEINNSRRVILLLRSFSLICVLAYFARLGAPLSDSGPTCTPKCSSDEREQEGEDARDREDRGQPLLRDVLRSLPGRTGQCDAAKLVYETCAHRCSDERQYNRYH